MKDKKDKENKAKEIFWTIVLILFVSISIITIAITPAYKSTCPTNADIIDDEICVNEAGVYFGATEEVDNEGKFLSCMIIVLGAVFVWIVMPVLYN